MIRFQCCRSGTVDLSTALSVNLCYTVFALNTAVVLCGPLVRYLI
jgi:hypothetical protein